MRKLVKAFTLDADVYGKVESIARSQRSSMSALVNYVLAERFLGASNRDLKDTQQATPRQVADEAVKDLWGALQKLADSGSLTDSDLELCAPVSKHPAAGGKT